MTNELTTIRNSLHEIEVEMGAGFTERFATKLNNIEESAKVLDARLNRINNLSESHIGHSVTAELLEEYEQ